MLGTITMAITAVIVVVKTALTVLDTMLVHSVQVLTHLIIPQLVCALVIGISIAIIIRTDATVVVVVTAAVPAVILMDAALFAKLTGLSMVVIATAGLLATNLVVNAILAMKTVGVVVVVRVIVVEVHFHCIIQVAIGVIVGVINTKQAMFIAIIVHPIPIHVMITQQTLKLVMQPSQSSTTNALAQPALSSVLP